MILPEIFSQYVGMNNSSGLGLYLSKNIVEKNNGIITAANNKEGAVFTIEFITWID